MIIQKHFLNNLQYEVVFFFFSVSKPTVLLLICLNVRAYFYNNKVYLSYQHN